jgi:hypothetical protein
LKFKKRRGCAGRRSPSAALSAAVGDVLCGSEIRTKSPCVCRGLFAEQNRNKIYVEQNKKMEVKQQYY